MKLSMDSTLIRPFATLAALFISISSLSQAQTVVIDTDFNDDPALNLFGVAQLTNAKGGVDGSDDNYISVTDNLNGQRGSIVFDDPTGGFPITGFKIRADLRVGGGTNSPADGFSFNLVRDNDPLIGTGSGFAASPTGEANLPEEGSTTGLAIGFDEWFSGGSDTIGMSVRLDNVILQEISLPNANGELDDITSLQTGPLGPNGEDDDSILGWAPLEIILDAGNLSIDWKGNRVFSGPVNWTPSPAQIVLGGRTGGARANHHMDNLFVEVTGDEIAVISGIRTGIDFVEFDVVDIGVSVLDPATISLVIDGNDVTTGLSVNKVGDVTTIRHDRNPQFPLGADISYKLIAEDMIGQLIERESTFKTPDPDIAVSTSLDFIEFKVIDLGASVLQAGKVSVLVNGANVTPSLAINKVGDTTTIRYNQDPIFPFGSTVTYEFDGTDNLGQLFEFDGQFVADQPYFPYQKELAGAEEMAVDGNWGVRYIFGAGTLNDLETVLTVIGDAADDPVNFAGTIVDTSEPEMNHSDNGSRFTIQPDLPYHPDAIAAGLPADDFIMYGVACMRIEEAGTYTIGVHSDDGFGLRVHGWTFTEAFGGDTRDARNGTIDPSSPDTIIHPSVTGDSNVRAVAENVQPGLYRIEFTWYERGGGDHGEIYIAKGRYPNDADTSEWLPIGRTESAGSFGIPGFDAAGVDVTSIGPGLLEDPLSGGANDFDRVLNPNGGGDDGLTNFAEVENALANPALDPVVTIGLDSVNFNDPQAGGPGRIPGDIPFPIDTGADDNDFLIEFSANLVIPVSGTYSLGFQGDDGAYLRIPGQKFDSISQNATGDSVIDEAGARLICDCLTGDSSTIGTITLTAGTYPVEGAFFERGGGAYFEVFGGQVGSQLTLIEKGGARSVELPRRGVALVSKAQSIRITDFIYDQSNDKLTISWTAREGKTYGLFLSPDLSDWGGDINDSISAIDSNPDPLAKFDPESGIMTYGPLPNPEAGASRLYFRVVENQN